MLNVLLVDNEAVICKGLTHCIDWAAFGCSVMGCASDGLEALDKMRTHPADIVVSDIRMPGMDGMALAEALARDFPETKVVILTGFPDFEYAQRAIQYHVVDFVLKPTSADKLRQAIGKAVGAIEKERGQRSLVEGLQVKDAENIKLRQERLLYDLIFGAPPSLVYAMQQGVTLGLNLTSYYILRFAVYPGDEMSVPDYDFSPAVEEAQKLVREAFSAHQIGFVSRGGRACYVFAGTTGEEALAGCCYEVVRIAAALTDFTISFGISSYYVDPTQMRQAAAEADSAQQFSAGGRDAGVMSYKNLPRLTTEDGQWVAKQLRLLTAAMENGSLSQALALYAEFRRFLSGVAYAEARRVNLVLYNQCVSLLYDYGQDGDGLRGRMLAAERAIEEGEAAEAADALEQFLRETVTRVGQDTEGMDSMIADVKTYIQQNYQKELPLETLAGVVHLSPSYLSKLFKKETGENLSGYIQSVRIDRAKLLLRTTTKKTYEVAEEVGIYDPVYFSRIFKKVTGVKPKDYKASCESDK